MIRRIWNVAAGEPLLICGCCGAEGAALDACTVRVTRQLNKPGAVPVFGPPKSRAGRRVVDFADLIVPDLRQHLGAVPAGALAFTSPEGTALSNTNFRRRVWLPALAAAGLSEIHIHDLRHTGNPVHGRCGGEYQGTHGPDGARQRARRADLSALV
jgi:integrase